MEEGESEACYSGAHTWIKGNSKLLFCLDRYTVGTVTVRMCMYIQVHVHVCFIPHFQTCPHTISQGVLCDIHVHVSLSTPLSSFILHHTH